MGGVVYLVLWLLGGVFDSQSIKRGLVAFFFTKEMTDCLALMLHYLTYRLSLALTLG